MLKRALGRIWSTVHALVSRWNADECSWRSAAVAFYGAFAMFPMCLLLMAGFGYVARFSKTAQSGQVELINLVEESASPWVAAQVALVLSQIKSEANIGGPVGLSVLVIAAIGIFLQLDAALDRIWHGPAQASESVWAAVRGLLMNRLVAFLLLLGVGIVLLAVMLANLSLTSVEKYVTSWSAGIFLWRVLQRSLTPLIYVIVFTLIYKVFPKARIRWWHALQGAVLAAAGWWLGQLGLQWVLVGDHYTAYGVIGAFMAILAWLYYSSAALFLGAELVRLRGEQLLQQSPTVRED